MSPLSSDDVGRGGHSEMLPRNKKHNVHFRTMRIYTSWLISSVWMWGADLSVCNNVVIGYYNCRVNVYEGLLLLPF